MKRIFKKITKLYVLTIVLDEDEKIPRTDVGKPYGNQLVAAGEVA